MIKTFVDLTEPITNNHWQHRDYFRDLNFVKRGVTLTANYMNLGEGFTTITYPYCSENSDNKTYYNKSVILNNATVIDISSVKANEAITEEMLKDALGDLKPEHSILIKTSWGLCHDFYSRDYAVNAPILTMEAASYLKSLSPKNIAFDFPIHKEVKEIFLEAGIAVIEGLNFMWKFKTKTVELYAMTLNLVNLQLPTEKIRVVIAY